MDNSEFLEKASKGTLSFRYNQFPTTTLMRIVACGFIEVISLLGSIQSQLRTRNKDDIRYGGPTW